MCRVASVGEAGGAEALELLHDDAIAVRVGDLVGRVGAQLERAEAHVGGVDRQDATDERLADAHEQLDDLERLDAADDAGQHTEHTGFGAAGGQFERGRPLAG